jgi:hypothetical protein
MEEIAASRIDAVLQATKQLFNHLHADWGGQQIRRRTPTARLTSSGFSLATVPRQTLYPLISGKMAL